MPNEQIVEIVAKEQYVEHLVAKIFNIHKFYSDFDYIGDLSQDIYVTLLELDNDKLNKLYENGELYKYIQGIATRNICSKTSPFYYKYKKYYSFIDGNKEIENY